MKKIFALKVVIALSCVISGCIPVGEKTVSDKVLGERKTEDSQVSEQILQTDSTSSYFVILHPDGPGKYEIGFVDFYLKKGEKRISLSNKFFDPCDYGYVLQPVLPVQGSSKWIAARLSRVEYYYVDIELIVFDEKRIYRTLDVKKCVRTNTSHERWSDLFNYGITSEDRNTKIVFHTNKGEYLFDVINNTFEKK